MTTGTCARVALSAAYGLVVLACSDERSGSVVGSSTDSGADSRADAASGEGGVSGSAGAGGNGGGSAGADAGNAGSAGNGGTGGAGGGGPCPGQNPAGCANGACAAGTTCSVKAGCAPSSCSCSGDQWTCGQECLGGVCVGTQNCSAEANALAKDLPTTGACTGIVRLKYIGLQVISHAFVCGGVVATTESGARAAANAASGFGDGVLLSGSAPVDAWVFRKPPKDFGGVAVVSAHTGLAVFGASIVWAGTGQVSYPLAWHQSIGTACIGPKLPSLRGFDLSVGKPLMDPETVMAASAAFRTAIPAALSQVGMLQDTVVLRYTPAVGFTVPGEFLSELAEYVVIIQSGS